MVYMKRAVTIGFGLALVLSVGVSAAIAEATSGSVAGVVMDAADEAVAGACVVLCEEATGLPLFAKTRQPLSEPNHIMDLLQAITDAKGRFRFERIPAGSYRVFAQTWDEEGEASVNLMEMPVGPVEFRGTVSGVEVPSEQAGNLKLRTSGTGDLLVRSPIGIDGPYVIVSTSPIAGDPVLGFAAWSGGFTKNILSVCRMRRGEAKITGLPEGEIHIAIFANDNNPGFGGGDGSIVMGKTTEINAPIIAMWSNGHHDPPERLEALVEKVSADPHWKDSLVTQVPKYFDGLQGKRRPSLLYAAPYLEREVVLPDGEKVKFGDLLAAQSYVDIQKHVRARAERAKKPSTPSKKASQVSYEDAFKDLYTTLGRQYPCFELKAIDWSAVGDELLTRAKEVDNDEAFGLLCMELVARLEDSHAALLEGAAKVPRVSFPQWDPGFACLIGDKGLPAVYYVDKGGPAEKAGVTVGMTVMAVNGKASSDVIESIMTRTRRWMGYSSSRYLEYHAAQWLARQTERGAMVSVEMAEPDGKEHSFEIPATLGVRYLPRLPVPSAGIRDSGSVSWKWLDKKIGYIYVRRISGDLIESLDKAVGEFEDAEGLIIDVRGNSGGGFDSRRAVLNFALDRDDEEPERPRYKGPMALLVDARCISAGEGWASWFVANKRARVFGQATAGASSRKTTYTLSNGLFKVRFPVKAYKGYLDRPIERRGLEPDVPVMLRAEDLVKGQDTVLAAARDYLLTKTAYPK